MNRRLLVAFILSPTIGLALAGWVQQAASQSTASTMAMPTTKGSLQILSPTNGQAITNTNIPVQAAVSNFTLTSTDVGRPDVTGEGHIHVMLDGMTMGVLFNLYTSPNFTLPGRGITPGKHTLIFDLASNTHEDFANTVQKVNFDYEPAVSLALPSPVAGAQPPMVKILSPANGATVLPKFTITVSTPGFTPSTELEGKPNIAGYGHLHVFVDMKAMKMPGGMMSMAGMIGMPGSNTFPVDLTGWPDGPHTLTVMAVQDDHTPLPGAMPAMIPITLKH